MTNNPRTANRLRWARDNVFAVKQRMETGRGEPKALEGMLNEATKRLAHWEEVARQEQR